MEFIRLQSALIRSLSSFEFESGSGKLSFAIEKKEIGITVSELRGKILRFKLFRGFFIRENKIILSFEFWS